MQQAIIAALAALLGLVVGRFWDTRSEAGRWQRDQRIRIYEQFIGAYYASREAYRTLALTEVDTPEADEAFAKALDLAVDFNRSVVAVWFHGTPDVATAVYQVDLKVNELAVLARQRKYSWEDWRTTRGGAEHAAEHFTQSVRRELGLPETPVTLCYPPHDPAGPH
ncbi:hypothetical protein [Actinokineospora inagensis]|uniref:hypothetical protein n=1 Tax=Actinokineospora inagensis TaxID=103730 RepID=UPI0003F792F2|nr:hypothetical protein [Actinokineospora inagensis]